MKINRIHATLGFLLVVVPLLGFGHAFKNGFSIFAGAVILFFAVQSIQNEFHKKHRRPQRHDTFVEGKPPEPKTEERSEPKTKYSHIADITDVE
jgi:hypothetical protein